MNNNYKISIILPVYNVEKYIDKCLYSIINQTYNNLEIILIDDGSPDNSGKICDQYAKNDSRIKVIHQKNSGVSKARNNGLDIATGDFVMFVDPDDWLELNSCEILVNKINQTGSDMIIYNYIKETNTKSIKNSDFTMSKIPINLNIEIQKKILAPYMKLKKFNITGIGFACNKIIRNEFLKGERFPLEGYKAINEDVLFFNKILNKKIKVFFCNEYLYHYRYNLTSATYAYNKDIISINKIVYDEIIKYNKDDYEYKQAVYIRMIRNLCRELTLNIFNEKNNLNFKEKIALLKSEINSDHIRESITNVKIKYIEGIYLKAYFILFKYKMYYLIYLLSLLEKKIRERI